MLGTNRREPLVLLLGDIVILYAALWLTLSLRYLSLPSRELLITHLVPFSILFLVWIAVFFIAGLYDKHTLLFKSRLPRTVFLTQLANVILAVGFFYVIPYFGITPKTILFLYLVISFSLVLPWRLYGPRIWSFRRAAQGLLIGSGDEIDELQSEVNDNSRYGLEFVAQIDINDLPERGAHEKILNHVYEHSVSYIVVDVKDERIDTLLPYLYRLMHGGIHFLDLHTLYEEVFDRIPISLIRYDWFLEHISFRPRTIYAGTKRMMDIIISTGLLLASLPLWPFIAAAITWKSEGPVFYTQQRIGRDNKPITLYKFRTMTTIDSGADALRTSGDVTRVGAFLRTSRLDEFPQLWNVLKGDLSLIGPRPEIPELVEVYEAQVSYYNTRHLIQPGLSGWAQLKDHDPARFGADPLRTANKLSYDLYYVKNRSLVLDLKITLQTIKTLLSRSGK